MRYRLKAKSTGCLLPGFALCVLLGFLNRTQPDKHRRLFLIATLYMLEPVLSRDFDPFNPLLKPFTEAEIDRAWWVFFVLVWNALFLSLFAYDYTVARRIHPISWGGYLWFCVAWGIVWAI